MVIRKIDHLVLTVADIDETIKFYTEVLGFNAVTFGDNRKGLVFGHQKINLHQKGKEIEPKAQHPTPGSADLCFIADTDLEEVMQELKEKNIEILEGIVDRTGAMGNIKSVYFRDPDQNLIEVSNY
ncbi:catechol 2,3-dioxygenase-like lactoylglutathione lyase family enzyme [Chryseobacterium sp. SORGH_AS 447]|uniref:VOC family protein n=1 Tax=Chryseobacterium sp. SORGH_AS_0447 TaxID=3041769 RepID=UPI00277D970D|nr:VOC family protein [Chryseobacterium sp. SORGH_AS_0447]MDQ1163390.1 catechol 2,3-dioxygenase-like lactoylglutathione lyase family enzyme [Chryseobacterium sp. SORGH_AS_0447]